MTTMVLVEPGSIPEGDFDRMLRMIRLTAQIGADVFKNEWTSSPERMAERRGAAEYLWSYRKLAWPVEWHQRLANACKEQGLLYATTCYLPEDVNVVWPFCDYIKVASFEAGDLAMREALTPHLHRTIVSLGMGASAAVWEGAAARLHCVSAYPAPVEQMNLAAIRARGLDGLSDHSRHPWTGALAVMAGARFVEFHARLNDTDPKNADYLVARAPYEADEYVRHIRLAELMLGTGAPGAAPIEAGMLPYRVRT